MSIEYTRLNYRAVGIRLEIIDRQTQAHILSGPSAYPIAPRIRAGDSYGLRPAYLITNRCVLEIWEMKTKDIITE